MRPNRVALWLVVSAVMPVAINSVAMPVKAANSPQIQGTKCAKTGATRQIAGVSYSCTKVGKTLKWQIASRNTTTTTIATKTTVPRKTATQVVAEKITTFAVQMRTRNQSVPTVEYRFGPSVSEADRIMTRQLVEAFFKYGAFPQLANYRNAISVALSQQELVETTAELQNISDWGSVGGGYSGTGTFALVLQNYTVHRCGSGVTTATCQTRDNGGTLGRYRLRVNVLHELSHGGKIALMGYDPSQSNWNLERTPMWITSGISNVQGAMLLAVIDGATYTNPNISVSEGRRCINAPISVVSQTDSSDCRGMGTGDFANEVLVARFGLDKVLEFVAGSAGTPRKGFWSDWSGAWGSLFQQLFLQSPASFEKDVEIYRNAVIDGKDLPADFLDAKGRP